MIGQTNQLNVAQLGMRVTDKDATPRLAVLWQPLCYAQIGGLLFATFVTLLLAPVFYSVFVLDLKIVKWQKIDGAPQAQTN